MRLGICADAAVTMAAIIRDHHSETPMSDPLLTAAEWTNWRRARALNDAHLLEMMLSILARAGRWTAIAALALDGQPDGFTGADVCDVITAAGDERQVATKGGPAAAPARELATRLDTIAGKLARLRAHDPPAGT